MDSQHCYFGLIETFSFFPINKLVMAYLLQQGNHNLQVSCFHRKGSTISDYSVFMEV